MLIVWLKILHIPWNLFAQVVCPGPKVLDFNEKRFHWVSVVRGVDGVLPISTATKAVFDAALLQSREAQKKLRNYRNYYYYCKGPKLV